MHPGNPNLNQFSPGMYGGIGFGGREGDLGSSNDRTNMDGMMNDGMNMGGINDLGGGMDPWMDFNNSGNVGMGSATNFATQQGTLSF